jgi:hypothetical protein
VKLGGSAPPCKSSHPSVISEAILILKNNNKNNNSLVAINL